MLLSDLIPSSSTNSSTGRGSGIVMGKRNIIESVRLISAQELTKGDEGELERLSTRGAGISSLSQ